MNLFAPLTVYFLVISISLSVALSTEETPLTTPSLTLVEPGESTPSLVSITTLTTTSTTPKPTVTKAPIKKIDHTELPDFTSFKNTSTFSCEGRITGYYADVKLSCRVYHFCTQLETIGGQPSYQRMSYICLEGSYFDQKDLNCVRKDQLRVPCNKAETEFESSNKQFDAVEESGPSISDSLTANIMMNPLARLIAGR